MKKFIYVYLKPEGATFIRLGPLSEDAKPDLGLLWNQIQKDGGVTADKAVIPTASIHRIELLDIEVEKSANLTVFPGGKPN